ncbi:30S ribosomal subunit S22 [Erwinia sp. CPCC 100877]|nr:30S ribosomal subunit S22 [Erwinia sp. CPCC 100877]
MKTNRQARKLLKMDHWASNKHKVRVGEDGTENVSRKSGDRK